MELISLQSSNKTFLTLKELIRDKVSTSSTLWKMGVIYIFVHYTANTISDFISDKNSLYVSILWLLARILTLILAVFAVRLYNKYRAIQHNHKKAMLIEFIIAICGAGIALINPVLKLNSFGGHLGFQGKDITTSSFTLAFDYLWLTILVFLLFQNVYGVASYILIVLGGFTALAFSNEDYAGGVKLLIETLFLLILILFAEKLKRSFRIENKKLKVEDKFHRTILDSLPESILVVLQGGIIKFQNEHMKKIFCWDLTSEMQEFYSCFSDFKFRGFDEEGAQSGKNPLITTQRMSSLEIQMSSQEFKDKISKTETIEHAMNIFQNYAQLWTKLHGNTFIFDCQYKHPLDENLLSVQIKAFIFNEDDQAQLTFIFQDTTSRDRIAALQSENEVYRNNIIASFSHELRTPLHSNMGLLEQGLLRDDVTSEVRQEIIEPALASANLLLHVINDILDYSQVLNGDFHLNIKPESITNTIDSCVNLLKTRIEAKNLKLNVTVHEEQDWLLNTDHKRLSQIFINILNNALKFTFEGSLSIEFRKHPDDDEQIYRLTVTDTGIGMDHNTQEKLKKNLAANKEMQSTLSSDSAGIGLGLFMSNACCRLMSPDFLPGVHFESEKNKGSSFYFYIKDFSVTEIPILHSKSILRGRTFPGIASETESSLSPVATLLKGHTTRGMKNKLLKSQRNSIEIIIEEKNLPILLVDDEVFNLMILERLCSTINLSVVKAFNGKQAIEKVQDIYQQGSKIKLIFMDVNMPIMDGYETTKRLKKMVELKQIQDVIIVGVTAYVSKDKIAKCYECGMDEVVHKPLSHADFLRVMNKYGFSSSDQ